MASRRRRNKTEIAARKGRRTTTTPFVRPGLVLVDAPPAPLWLQILIPLVVVAAAFFTFLPALDAKFLDWDDDKVIVNNSFIRGLSEENVDFAWHRDKMGHYHPLTWLSYALEYEIGKWRYDQLSDAAQARYERDLDPKLFHFTNMVLHAGVALGFYFLARLLLRAFLPPSPERRDIFTPIAAGLAALLFACHPLRVETVAWATERRDVLSSVFLVPALICYIKYAVHRNGYGLMMAFYLGSLALLTISLLGKAWGITLPAVMLLLDIYPLRRLGGKAGWLSPSAATCMVEKVPFLAVAVVFARWASAAQRGQFYTAKTWEEWTVGDRIAQAFYGLKFYAYKTLAPFNLTPIVELPLRHTPDAPKYLLLTPPFLLAAAVVIAAVILLIVFRKKWPAGIVAALCYAGILSPVLGVHQSGPQLVADRYSYLSCMPWAIVGGAGLLWLYRRKSQVGWARSLFVPACVASVGVVGALGALTWRQTKVWQDSWSLWTYACEVNPKCVLASTLR